METFFPGSSDGLTHEAIMRGVESMRVQNQTVDALCDVFSLSWDSGHSEEVVRLLSKEILPALQLSKHSTKLQKKLDQWCEQVRAISFTEAHTDILIQTVLPKFKSLESLAIHSTIELNTSTLLGHLHLLSSLKEIDFSGCSFVNDQFLKALAKAASQLTLLDLSRCSGVGNEGLGAILLANAQTLRRLRLSGKLSLLFPLLFMLMLVSGTMDVYFNRFKSPNHTQKHLSVTRGSPKVSHSSLVPFIKASKMIEELNLEYSLTSPNDASVDSIATPAFLEHITILRLMGCYSVTDRHLVAISAHCPLLVELSLGISPSYSSFPQVRV